MIAILGAVNAAVRHARGRHSWAGSEAEAESGAGLPVKSAVFARAVGGWGEVEVIGERCEEDSAYGKRQLLAEAGDPGYAQRRVFTARRSALAEEAVGVKLLGIFKDVAAVMALAHADSHKPYEVASANRLPRLPDEVFALLGDGAMAAEIALGHGRERVGVARRYRLSLCSSRSVSRTIRRATSPGSGSSRNFWIHSG